MGDIKITIINDYLKNWESFVLLRNNKLGDISYANEQGKFVLLLFARINALCEEVLSLVKINKTASIEIILRSVLESYIDLKCLVNDPNFLKVILQDERRQDIKYYNKHSPSNPYNNNISEEEAKKMLKMLLSMDDEKSKMSVYKKFEKVNELDAYYTIYNHLCRHSHGNITALASNSFQNGRVVINKASSDKDLNLFCSSTINAAIASAIEMMAFFKFDGNEIDSMKNLLEKNGEQALRFKEIIQSSK